MKLYEKEMTIPLIEGNKELLNYFSRYLSGNLSPNNTISPAPLKFAVTKTDDKGYHCELGILDDNDKRIDSIFNFRRRECEKTDKFNAVLVIPTGIDAVLGGHAVDAGALARLMASACDTLITHPNVVNGSDINELPDNDDQYAVRLWDKEDVISLAKIMEVKLTEKQVNDILGQIDRADDVKHGVKQEILGCYIASAVT